MTAETERDRDGAGRPTTLDSPASNDIEAVRSLYRRGARVDFLFFWDDEATSSSAIGKECLSQWFPSEFTVGGLRFPTAEHFMMHGKARLFGDEQVATTILSADTPATAKALGREVRGFDQARWEAHRRELVTSGNFAKFSQSAELRCFLFGTGDRILVEASPVDRIWGIGMAANDPRCDNPLEWPGLNLLGFALMDVRQRLRALARSTEAE